jgi:hypothetical protein
MLASPGGLAQPSGSGDRASRDTLVVQTMGKDQQRIGVVLLVYLGCLVAGTLILDWFVIHVSGQLGGIGVSAATIGIDLRSIHVCAPHGPCTSVTFGGAHSGAYPAVATITFWGGIAAGLIVAALVATRLANGVANPSLAKFGFAASILVAITALFAGFVCGPERVGVALPGGGLTLARTWAPALTVLAHLLGLVVCYLATREPGVELAPPAPASPYVPAATARTMRPTQPPATAAPDKPPTGPIPTAPPDVRGKISFATLTAEVSRAGIDARREDRASLLVLWRDVVGLVVRRLPPELEGATFVDLISTAGSTLRILPWTRLSGEPLAGEGDARVRALVSTIVARCPEAKLDHATRVFMESRDPAAQLPDAAMLAMHDRRLA